MDRGVVLVVVAACGWGTWSLFLRPTGLPPVWNATLVFFLIAVISWPLFRLEGSPRWDRTTWIMLAALAVLDALNVGAYFAAIDVTSVAIAVLTHCVAPVIVALASPWIEGQRVRYTAPAGLAALFGLVLLLQPWSALQGNVVLGAALGGASAIGYAGNVFLLRRLTPRIGAFRTLGIHSVGSGILLLPLALAQPAAIEGRDLLLLAAGAALLGVGGCAAFARGLVRIGAARAAIFAFLEPVVACAVGFAVWSEPFDELGLIGALLVLAAGMAVVFSGPASATPVPRS